MCDFGDKKYEKVRLLGVGATAEVFQVKEKVSGQYYAVKCSKQQGILLKEAELLKALTYPMFPRVKEYDEKNGKYMVMEYFEGNSLQEIMDKGNNFTLAEKVYIIDRLLKGLSYLHLQEPGIVYRDLKPANVIITSEGNVKLIDFGAAYYNRSEEKEDAVMAGTNGYAAPEQFWKGVRPDKRCDIYATGKLFAYLLSDKNPAEPPYDMEMFCKGLKKVPVEFLEIIERSLAIDPQARFEDCESMRREIQMAFEKITRRGMFKVRRKQTYTYKKCIWLSEYRRIF